MLEQPPNPLVARFLGFDGSPTDGPELLMTRPAHVTHDPTGPLRAPVTRTVPLEDGVRLELAVDNGRLYTVAALPAPGAGEHVRVRHTGGVRFTAPAAATSSPSVSTT